MKETNLLTEMASSMRLLLRHAITAPHGGGVPPAELFAQIRRLDASMGAKPHVKEKKFRSEKTHPVTAKPSQEPQEPPSASLEPVNGDSSGRRASPDGEPLVVLRDGKWVLKK